MLVNAVEGLGRVPDPQQPVNEDPAPRMQHPNLENSSIELRAPSIS